MKKIDPVVKNKACEFKPPLPQNVYEVYNPRSSPMDEPTVRVLAIIAKIPEASRTGSPLHYLWFQVAMALPGAYLVTPRVAPNQLYHYHGQLSFAKNLDNLEAAALLTPILIEKGKVIPQGPRQVMIVEGRDEWKRWCFNYDWASQKNLIPPIKEEPFLYLIFKESGSEVPVEIVRNLGEDLTSRLELFFIVHDHHLFKLNLLGEPNWKKQGSKKTDPCKN